MYAFVRTQKIKSSAHLTKAARHNTREAKVANADPDKRHLNHVLVPCENIVQKWENRTQGIKVRSNAVIAVEVFIGRSPGQLKGSDRDWEQASMTWLRREFGKDNVLSAVAHYDEQTPHIQAVVVPIDERNKLNCRKFLGGAERLGMLQTSYADAVRNFGLERGVKGSRAEHTTIREYYEAAQKSAELSIAEPRSALGITSAAEARRLYREAETYRAALQNETIQRQKAEIRVRETEKRALILETKLDFQSSTLKRTADKVRALPLKEVLERMGAQQNRHDSQKWQTESGVVVLEKEGLRFNSFDGSELKGRGAIDLVMGVTKVDFKEAVSWLSSEFGRDATAAELAANTVSQTVFDAQREYPRTCIQPIADPSKFFLVSSYLTQTRKISPDIVERLNKAGLIYADRYANAVFVHKDPFGYVRGVELRGTGSTAFHGHRGRKAGFLVDPAWGNSKYILCESAIDALSVRQLTGAGAVGLGGDNSAIAQQWCKHLKIDLECQILCGFDNDSAGEKQYQNLRKTGLELERVLPRKCKDWNEYLQRQTEWNKDIQHEVSTYQLPSFSLDEFTAPQRQRRMERELDYGMEL